MFIAKMPDGKAEIYPAVQGEGPSIGEPCVFVRCQMCNLNCHYCWGAGTKILLANGLYKNIEDIKKGELVMSYKDKGYVVSKVVDTTERETDSYVELVTEEGISTKVTADHVYYVNHHKGKKKVLKSVAGELEGSYIKKSLYSLVEPYKTTRSFDVGYFKGALIGDGCSQIKNGYLWIWFQVCDRDFIEEIARIGNDVLGFNSSITLSSRKTVKGKIVYRYSLAKDADKISYVLDLPINEEEERGFIAGFLDAEGSVGKNQLTISQKDTKLLYRVASMLQKFKFNPQIKDRANEGGVSVITINKKTEVDRFFKEFPTSIARKPEINKEKNRQLEAILVTKVTEKQKPIKVYNIMTTFGNCFANGYLAEQCDTSYTWYFKGLNDSTKHKYSLPVEKKKYTIEMSVEDVALEIRKAAGKIRRVVFTGGEPLLQQKDLIKVMAELEQDGESWVFEVETNGTIPFNTNFAVDQINCSPKLASSGNSLVKRDRPDVIEGIMKQKEDDVKICFKFVVGAKTFKEDTKEIREWEKRHNVPREFIYLMPEGITTEDIKKGTIYLIENCLKYGYKISTRLQVLLYNIKRAV